MVGRSGVEWILWHYHADELALVTQTTQLHHKKAFTRQGSTEISAKLASLLPRCLSTTEYIMHVTCCWKIPQIGLREPCGRACPPCMPSVHALKDTTHTALPTCFSHTPLLLLSHCLCNSSEAASASVYLASWLNHHRTTDLNCFDTHLISR